MATDQKAILELVYESIDTINDLLPESEHVPKAPDSVLFGQGGRLDSLNLVLLIVDIEQRIAEMSGQAISLTSERAMSGMNSPFRTVSSLVNFIANNLEGT